MINSQLLFSLIITVNMLMHDASHLRTSLLLFSTATLIPTSPRSITYSSIHHPSRTLAILYSILRPLIQNPLPPTQREIIHRLRINIQLESIITWIQNLIAHDIHARQTAERDVEGGGLTASGRDGFDSCIGGEAFDRVGLGAVLA